MAAAWHHGRLLTLHCLPVCLYEYEYSPCCSSTARQSRRPDNPDTALTVIRHRGSGALVSGVGHRLTPRPDKSPTQQAGKQAGQDRGLSGPWDSKARVCGKVPSGPLPSSQTSPVHAVTQSTVQSSLCDPAAKDGCVPEPTAHCVHVSLPGACPCLRLQGSKRSIPPEKSNARTLKP